MTETDSAISGGSVRDVLADTNNLSERWKTASGPVHCGPGPTTDDWGWADGAGGAGELHSVADDCCIPSSAITS